ncbi:Transcriptional regulatory protein ZraR [Thalassocella blandensis]|nr:Transcriptional regulatory protein ZraR [Thalassocella blandensis]
MKYNVIVIDDDIPIQRQIQLCLNQTEFEVIYFNEPSKALTHIQNSCVDILLLNRQIKQKDVIAYIQELRHQGYSFPIILIDDSKTPFSAEDGLTLNIFEVIQPEFIDGKLLFSLKKCTRYLQLKRKLDQYGNTFKNVEILGEHAAIKQLRQKIQTFTNTDSEIYISGEQGSDLSLVARNIHANSSRSEQSFIQVNCSLIQHQQQGDAIFGSNELVTDKASRKLQKQTSGFIEKSNRGTIYLHEISGLSLQVQQQLLQVLDKKEFFKAGASCASRIDIRFIASSTKDLARAVAQGEFNPELYQRLQQNIVTMPALREHVSDLPLLIARQLYQFSARHGLPVKKIDAACYPVLQAYTWPGNTLELANIVERMIIASETDIQKTHIPLEIITPPASMNANEDNISLREFKQRTEREFIMTQLRKHGGNISRLARSLQVDRTNLHKKLTQLDIKREKLVK